MDKVIENLLSNAGVVGAILVAVCMYLLKMEAVFWRERQEFTAQLQKNHEAFTQIMKDRYSEQQAIVSKQMETMDTIRDKIALAETSFAELKTFIDGKLDQMQAAAMQRPARLSSQKELRQ